MWLFVLYLTVLIDSKVLINGLSTTNDIRGILRYYKGNKK